MKTLMKPTYWEILQEFYKTNNTSIHLRELSRSIQLKEGPLSRHLKELEPILTSHFEGNLKKFRIKDSMKPEIFTAFDLERYKRLPFIRKNSIKFYINSLKEKPILIILFGSTAKGKFNENSDIDIISVFNKKVDTKEALRRSESQTGIKINEFQLTYNQFVKELKLKEDNVIQAGLENGFPIYNHMHFYEVITNGSKNTQKINGGQ